MLDKYPHPKYEVNRLMMSYVSRVVITLVILYHLQIPTCWKIILIMLSDRLDCMPDGWPRKGPLFSNNINICRTELYQHADKITDTICYFILLHYIVKKEKLSPTYNKILSGLLVYRTIGTVLFLLTNNRHYLIYFPNFFLELSLALMLMKHYPKLRRYKKGIFVGVVVVKIVTEIYLHA